MVSCGDVIQPSAVAVERSPEQLLQLGQLTEALQGLTVHVRHQPQDVSARVFLFQLLALLGQWERAQVQLNVAGELDSANVPLVNAYSVALKGEQKRDQVFAAQATPDLPGIAAQWREPLLRALHALRAGDIATARTLREAAFSSADAVSGHVDGARFAWIADADTRFGPCLEIILNTGYAWIPFADLLELRFEQPTDLRDMVWAPVQITWRGGQQAVGFIPSRYPDSLQVGESGLALARQTKWRDLGDECFVGLGQRMLVTDAGDYPLLQIRTLTFDRH